MASDKKAEPDLQTFGQQIDESGPVKTNRTDIVRAVDDPGDDIDALVSFAAKGEGDANMVAAKASKFKAAHAKEPSIAKSAMKHVHDLATDFKKIERKLS